jgi:hypothetical protein
MPSIAKANVNETSEKQTDDMEVEENKELYGIDF